MLCRDSKCSNKANLTYKTAEATGVAMKYLRISEEHKSEKKSTKFWKKLWVHLNLNISWKNGDLARDWRACRPLKLDCNDWSSASKIIFKSEIHQKKWKFKVKNNTTASDDIIPGKVGLVKETCYVFDRISSLVDKESQDNIAYFDFTRSKPRAFQTEAAVV